VNGEIISALVLISAHIGFSNEFRETDNAVAGFGRTTSP